MEQEQKLQIGDVIDRASQHLREYHQLSENTVKKHRDNWHSLLDFAEKQGLLLVRETICEQFIEQQLQDEQEKLDSKCSQLYSTRLLQEYIRNGRILSTKEMYEFHGEIGVSFRQWRVPYSGHSG
jgi:hypothetical protein